MTGRRALLVAPLALLGACALTFEGRFDPALFGRTADAAPPDLAPGRVALVVRPAVRDQVHRGSSEPDADLRLPLGRIVEEALAAALGDTWRGGVQRLEQGPAPPPGAAATLVLEAAHVVHDQRLLWAVPIPVFPFLARYHEIGARLAIDVGLLDTRGHAVWTRSYDSGRELYEHSFWSREPIPAGLVRMAHVLAWRLARQVAADVRAWQQAERQRLREL